MDATVLSLISLLANLLLGGGLLHVILKYRTDNRKLDNEEEVSKDDRKRSELEKALDIVVKQRNNAIETIDKLNARIDHLELEVQGLRLARDLDPFPNWIVDLEGRYIYVNVEFERQFLTPRGISYRQVIGEKHEAIWPEPFVCTLRNLDAVARRVPDGSARARTAITINDVPREITVHKFPIRVREGVVAFAGFITAIDDLDGDAPSIGDRGEKR